MNDQHTTSADSFISHLVELRRRVIRALLAVALVFLGLVGWAADIFRWLARPLLMNLPKDGKMIVTDVTGSFFVPVKVTLLLALPCVLYQLWAFVAPGLYRHEGKWIAPLVGSSYALFLAGMAFAYFVVFPTVFRIMAHYNAPLNVQMTTDISHYLSFVLTLFVAFGMAFEVPVAVVLLVHTGALTVEKLKKSRPYAVVGAFIVAAIVTPPDVISQLMLAVPLVALYEAGLWAARVITRRL